MHAREAVSMPPSNSAQSVLVLDHCGCDLKSHMAQAGALEVSLSYARGMPLGEESVAERCYSILTVSNSATLCNENSGRRARLLSFP